MLGGSPEPYANNPLRIRAIAEDARPAQRDRAGFDDLITVLNFAQSNPNLLSALVYYLLSAIRDRLADATVIYPVPNRTSLNQALAVIDLFVADRTGGLRLQAVVVALFRTIAGRLQLFTEVRSNHINAADASTGNSADLECLDSNGNIVLAIEVKDRNLRLRPVQDKLPAIREKGIRELLFLTQGGPLPAEKAQIDELVERQFTSGQNIYVEDWDRFLSACLILFGESGRREFLKQIGDELDLQRADITHRRKWADLLARI